MIDEVLNFIKELFYIFPDSIIFGSFLIGLITLSSPHLVFSLSLVESLVILSIVQNGVSYLIGGSIPTDKCKSHFHKFTFPSLLLKPSGNYPSYSAYIVSTACTYLAYSLYSIQDELNSIDKSYYISYSVSFWLLLILAILYSVLLSYLGCDSISSILSGYFIGILIGCFLVYQNKNMLSNDVINFLSVPLLRNLSSKGEPLYFCSSTSS